ncbi:MAG: class I SAM-dependent methyltransferase [Candidatus Heimdallarchaeota archaeon]
MIPAGPDFYFVVVLMALEVIVLGLFTFLYIKKQQIAFLALVVSALLFLLGNTISLIHMFAPNVLAITFFQGLLAAGGLIPIVIFLEMFENGVAFTPRSSLSIVFILLIGAGKGASKLLSIDFHGPLEVEVGNFFNFIAPILFILVGTFYINALNRMKDRIRFENQKSKIRKVKTGIWLTFILPKFISGSIFTISILPAFIWKDFDVNLILGQQNVFDFVVNFSQIIGLIVMSLPIIFSQSVFFMQSQKIKKLIVINKDGIPIFEFNFEYENISDEKLLNQAFVAISSIIGDKTVATQELRTINFGHLQIMTELREDFAVLLVVDRPTHFLNKSLETFTDEFNKILPEDINLNELRTQKLKFTAEKIIQRSFDLEEEEFEQIRMIVRQGYDKVADEYLATRSEEDEEVKLLPDFMSRLPEGSRILDAGCGAGEPITRILSEKFEVIGVDISRKQIEIAREILPQCEFVWQDMTTLTYPNDYFDGIISYYAIPHVPREEHKGLLENLHRMLRTDGLALLCFATTDDPGTVVDDFFGVKMYWSSFDAGTNVEMLKDTGFTVVWIKLIFDDVTDEQHLFVLAKKSVEEDKDDLDLNPKTKEKKEEK